MLLSKNRLVFDGVTKQEIADSFSRKVHFLAWKYSGDSPDFKDDLAQELWIKFYRVVDEKWLPTGLPFDEGFGKLMWRCLWMRAAQVRGSHTLYKGRHRLESEIPRDGEDGGQAFSSEGSTDGGFDDLHYKFLRDDLAKKLDGLDLEVFLFITDDIENGFYKAKYSNLRKPEVMDRFGLSGREYTNCLDRIRRVVRRELGLTRSDVHSTARMKSTVIHRRWTPEERARWSQDMKERWADPNSVFIKCITPQSKKHMSDSAKASKKKYAPWNKGMKMPPGYMSPETKAKIKASIERRKNEKNPC